MASIAIVVVGVMTPAFVAGGLPKRESSLSNEWLGFDGAKAYCDSRYLDKFEGIWEFVGDDVFVLLYHDSDDKYHYKMVVVDWCDATVLPGSMLGSVTRTADKNQVIVRIYTRWNGKRGLQSMHDYVAKVSENGRIINIEHSEKERGWRFSFNPTAILPFFRGLFRLSYSQPNESLPCGMVKVYPSYDDNGSSIFNPRVL